MLQIVSVKEWGKLAITNIELASIEKKNILALLFLTGGSIFFRILPLTLGVLLGGIIVVLNFKALRKIVGSLDKGRPGDASRIILFFSYLIRFLFVGGLVFLVIFLRITDPVGFLIGLSTVFFGIALEGISMSLKRTKKKEF